MVIQHLKPRLEPEHVCKSCGYMEAESQCMYLKGLGVDHYLCSGCWGDILEFAQLGALVPKAERERLLVGQLAIPR